MCDIGNGQLKVDFYPVIAGLENLSATICILLISVYQYISSSTKIHTWRPSLCTARHSSMVTFKLHVYIVGGQRDPVDFKAIITF